MLQPGFTAEIGGSSKRKETEIDRQQQKTRKRQTTTSSFFVLKFVRFKVQSKNIGNISVWLILSKRSTDYILYYILYCIPV